MGVGHWIGKKLGISRDSTQAEIMASLEKIKNLLEDGKLAEPGRELNWRLNTIRKQDKIKLRSLVELWYKKLIRYAKKDKKL